MIREEQKGPDWKEFVGKLEELDPAMRPYYRDHVGAVETSATSTYTDASAGMQIVPLFSSPPENLLPGTNTPFNSWHLQYIGVSKKHHQKGIGRALIEACERLVSSEESFLSSHH